MSARGKAFELGAVVVPAHVALGFNQRIETFGGSRRLRLGTGNGIQQTVWRRRRITLSGEGWCPPGLDALNYNGPLTLKCGLPVAVLSTATTVTLPTARRTDAGYLPFARAHLPDGWVETSVSITNHVATLGAVSGAISYSVWYWPQLSVLADPPSQEFDASGGAVAWELVCEEV